MYILWFNLFHDILINLLLFHKSIIVQQASLGIAELCVMAMKEEGLEEEEARSRIWMVDSKGLIVKNRPEGGLNENKIRFARERAPIATLAEVVNEAKPSVLIGLYS